MYNFIWCNQQYVASDLQSLSPLHCSPVSRGGMLAPVLFSISVSIPLPTPSLLLTIVLSFFFKSLSFPFHVTHTSLLTTSMFVLFLMLSLQTKWQSYPVDRIIGILSCKRIGADFFFKLSGLTAS